MKSMFVVVSLMFALAGPLMAHCGKCGMDGGDAHAGHSHADKAEVLMQASSELEKTNPELAAKVKEIADQLK